MDISVLNLSKRSRTALRALKVKRIGDLVQQLPGKLMGLDNFGSKSLAEIERALKPFGLSLGMRIHGWSPKD